MVPIFKSKVSSSMGSILHISPSLSDMSGISAVLNNYVETTLSKDHRLLFLASHLDGSRVRKFAVAFLGLFKLVYLIGRHNVSIVHIHCGDIISCYRKYAYFRLVRFLGPKVILHFHGASFLDQLAGAPGRRRDRLRFLFEKSDIVICVSQSWSDAIGEVFPKSRRVMIPNGVFLPVLREKANSSSVRIAFLGHIGARKGIFDLVSVVKRLIDEGYDVYLDIGGNGEVGRLMEEILRAGGRIRFHGWVTGADKENLLAQADIYVLPSYGEGMPISVLEAMSYGIPVVSTRVGGIPELVEDGVSGFLIAAGDREALYARLRILLENRGMRAEMGKKAREAVEKHHDIRAIAQRISDIYVRLDDMAPGAGSEPGPYAG